MTEFEHGALIAASILVAMHDQPTMAGTILNEMSLHEADCSDLDDFDKINLRKVQGEMSGKIRLRGL